MVRRYYCVKDIVADEFGDLIYAKNDAVASRLFANLVQSHKEINPDDLELYFIGTFDDVSGLFSHLLCKVSVGDDTSDFDTLS